MAVYFVYFEIRNKQLNKSEGLHINNTSFLRLTILTFSVVFTVLNGENKRSEQHNLRYT